MSDTYSVEDYMRETGREAQAATIGSMDDDPDDAARALELSASSGIAPTAIYGDLEGFERTYKSALSSRLIQGNPQLSQYLISHPLAAKVSHDDLGQLDAVSQSVSNFDESSKLTKWLQKEHSLYEGDDPKALGGAVVQAFKGMATPPKGFAEAFGTQPFGQARKAQAEGEEATSLEKATGVFSRPDDIAWALSHPVWAATAGRAVGLGELGMEGMARVTNGLIGLGRENIASMFGESTAGAFETAAEAMVDPATQETLMSVGPAGAIPAGLARGAEVLGSVLKAYKVASPWVRAGLEPPVGLHPLIDEAKKLQTKEDISALDQMLSEASKSAVRERSPELFANFIRQHIGDREIGIDPEAVRQLYEDKVPAGDDNILGWVPDLDKRLASAELTGADVRVPLADWLANVDPDVAKVLHDDIRVRDNGLTLNEGKIEAEPREVGPEHVQQIRGAAGLEPLAMAGDRKITLERKDIAPVAAGQTSHTIDMMDENGKTIGGIDITESRDGKQLYIDMINAGTKQKGFYQPNFLGPSLVRDVKRQLKEMFPQAETITGHRVSGAREAAGKEMEMDKPVVKLDIGEDPQPFRDLLQAHWRPIGLDWEVYEKPEPFWTENEKAIREAVTAELARLAPGVEIQVAHGLYREKEGVGLGTARGQYWKYGEGQSGFFTGEYLPKIFVALTERKSKYGATDIGVARHEAIHHLRQMGLISIDEWNMLKQTAQEQGWREKFEIDKRYSAWPEEARWEESIAEGYRTWRDGQMADPGVFQKIKDFIDAMHRKFKELLGKDFTWEEMFKEIDTGKVGRRDIDREAAREAAELAKPAEMAEDGEGFGLYDKGKALGVTQSHMDRMLDLIAKRNAEDFAASQRRAEVRQRRRSNKEWKERRTLLRDDVRESLTQRPDIALDQLFAKQKIKFNPAYLTEDQRARLPKDYIQKKDGVNPDELAPYFGYTSGDALVERLGMLTEDRRRSGMSPRDYLNRLIDVETDRRLNQEFGDRDANILAEATDQALSETQLNLVHEETLAFGLKAGIEEPPFTQAQVREMVKGEFDKQPVGSIDAMQFLQAAGKIGKKIEEAAAKGKWEEAYRLSQQRNHAVLYAKFARDYERSRAQFDRTAKQFRKREVASVPAEYTNWIHDILQRVGLPINRSLQDLYGEQGIGRQAETNLRDFVTAKEIEWMGQRELPVADFLYDPNFRKPVDELSHEDFMALKRSIDALTRAGRDMQKIIVEGETYDRQQYIGQMTNQLKDKFTKQKYAPGYEPGRLKRFMAGTSALATVFRRFDSGDRYGLWTRITNRMAEADNAASKLERDISKTWLEVMGDVGDLKKLEDKPPELVGWDYSTFTRENKLALVHAAGNDVNWTKTALGWGADPVKLKDWLIKNTTKEDWDRAQKFQDQIFKQLIKLSDNVYERVEGVPVERIPLAPFEVTFPNGEVGKYKGWYHPLFADPLKETKVSGQNNIGKFRNAAATRDGWTKARTKQIYPVDLSFSQIPAKLSEIIHDVTHKEPVVETSKLFRDRGLRQAVTDYYGKEYTDLLTPWLEDAAGESPSVGKNMRSLVELSNSLRTNAVNTYIAFNPSTPMKHLPTAFLMSVQELGWKNVGRFADAYRKLYLSAGKDNWAKLVDSFEEIERRERHWDETFGGAQKIIGQESTAKQKWNQWGSAVVAASDKFSARPLALARYLMELESHGNAGLAREQAELSVRRAHGSTAQSNLPELVRQNRDNLGHWMTTVYGFMGERMQRLIETGHAANDSWGFVKDGEITKAGKTLMDTALPRYFTYGIMVGAIEQLVESAFADKKKESWASSLAQIAFGHIWSSVLFGRDFASAIAHGERPSFGMFETMAGDVVKPLIDLHKGRQAFDRQHAGKSVKDLLTAGSIFTGIPSKTAASAAQFAIDRYNNIGPQPQSFGDYFRGISRGKPQRRQEK